MVTNIGFIQFMRTILKKNLYIYIQIVVYCEHYIVYTVKHCNTIMLGFIFEEKKTGFSFQHGLS